MVKGHLTGCGIHWSIFASFLLLFNRFYDWFSMCGSHPWFTFPPCCFVFPVCVCIQVFFTPEYLALNPSSKLLMPQLKNLMEELVSSACALYRSTHTCTQVDAYVGICMCGYSITYIHSARCVQRGWSFMPRCDLTV